MYPSGRWEGFWVQDGYGRQPMTAFDLYFRGAEISGGGTDVVGRFTVAGSCEPHTGRVHMVKQYVGRHRVTYDGMPDGEGCIAGTWNIAETYKGPFLIRPVVRPPAADAPIQDIG